MSERSELVLSGVLCESCGTLIDLMALGHPRKCVNCDRPWLLLRDADGEVLFEGRVDAEVSAAVLVMLPAEDEHESDDQLPVDDDTKRSVE